MDEQAGLSQASMQWRCGGAIALPLAGEITSKSCSFSSVYTPNFGPQIRIFLQFAHPFVKYLKFALPFLKSMYRQGLFPTWSYTSEDRFSHMLIILLFINPY